MIKKNMILSGRLQMDRFCLVKEFHWDESATNRAAPSSFIILSLKHFLPKGDFMDQDFYNLN